MARKASPLKTVETITHEQECWAQVLNPEFEAALRKLGEWLDVSGDTPLPLFSLASAEGMKWYKGADAR